MKVRTIGVNIFFWFGDACTNRVVGLHQPPAIPQGPKNVKRPSPHAADPIHLYLHLREFMLTTVILPRRVLGGSDRTDLVPKPRANQGACWARQTCFRELTYGHILSIMVQSRCSLYFCHRCARHPPADKPARRPMARIDEKNENRCSPLAIYTQYIPKNGHQNKKYGQNVTTYTDCIWP